MKNEIFITLENELKKIDKFVNLKGELLRLEVLKEIENLSDDILEIILNNEKLKIQFTKKFQEHIIIDKEHLKLFFNNKEFLPDSYTHFKNKIGLSSDNHFLNYNTDIILNFPYKDCVLIGGQTKDKESRKERFYNQIISFEEIDTLKEEKAFSNAIKIDSNGEHKVKKINESDNLLIKGNNLLALYSLRNKYKGKVKCIYIDVPYNTGSDSFGYNDSFNHSTWLTFMKNRIEVAKDFLTDDGVILVQINNSKSEKTDDSPELGYLMVLMDEIFKRNNFLSILTWKKKGGVSNTASNGIGTLTESILCYTKNSKFFKPKLDHLFSREYKFKDENGVEFNTESIEKTNEGTYKRETMYYPIIDPETNREFYPPKNKRWTIGKESIPKLLKENKLIFDYKNMSVKRKKTEKDYKNDKIHNNLLTDLGSTKSAKDQLKNIGFKREDFETPKPEELMEYLLEMFTNKKDLVMDFFVGSGTTIAVAHKMERQYIGIEQMDYIEKITKQRISKVIQGEQTGISKNQKWKGGGDFIYLELKEVSKKIINEILSITSSEEIKYFLSKIEKYEIFMSSDISLDDLKKEDFLNLPIQKQKNILIDIIDKNTLYLNYSEINDSFYKISSEEIELNNNFYGEQNDDII